MGSESKMGVGRRYRQSQHGQAATQREFEDYVFKKGEVEVWRPSWKNTFTTVRFLPAINPENGTEWDAYRLSDADNDFGDWIRTYPAVRNIGNTSKCTYLLYDPADTRYDPANNPTIIFHRNIRAAIKAGQGQGHWLPMMEGSQDRGADLPEPSEITMAQCFLYQHDSKLHSPARGSALDDKQPVLEMSVSAKYALFDRLNERTPNYSGPADDYGAMFTFGDIVSLDKGAYVRFCQEGSVENNTPQREPQRPGMSRRDSGDRRGRKPSTYQCTIVDQFAGYSAELTNFDEFLRARWKPWDSILNFLSDAEQVREIAKRFPADMVAYAFRDQHCGLVPDYVWAANRGRVTTGYEPAHGVASGGPVQAPVQTPTHSPGAAPRQTPYQAPAQAPAQRAEPIPTPGATTQAPAARPPEPNLEIPTGLPGEMVTPAPAPMAAPLTGVAGAASASSPDRLQSIREQLEASRRNAERAGRPGQQPPQ